MSKEPLQAELVPVTQNGIAKVPQQTEVATVLDVIARAANDPSTDVTKLERMVDLYERMRRSDAEAAYARAMKAAQQEMTPVVRDAENSHTRSRYARLETIDKNIRPIYTKHGFSLTFSQEDAPEGKVRMVCEVLHEAGHSKVHKLEGGLDDAGAKGTSNKTAIQALGSTTSYLRRYLTCMVFNIALTNEDTDGNADVYLNDQQRSNVIDMVSECGAEIVMQNFWNFARATSFETIKAADYERIMAMLRQKAKFIRERVK